MLTSGLAVGVADLTTGVTAVYHGTESFDTASIVKADILAVLQLQLQQVGASIGAADHRPAAPAGGPQLGPFSALRDGPRLRAEPDAPRRGRAELGCHQGRIRWYPPRGQEWLAADRPGGLWVINSIGVVSHAGQQLAIAVLSDGNPSRSAGIGLV